MKNGYEYTMDKRIRKKWLSRLRSGTHAQAQGALV